MSQHIANRRQDQLQALTNVQPRLFVQITSHSVLYAIEHVTINQLPLLAICVTAGYTMLVKDLSLLKSKK